MSLASYLKASVVSIGFHSDFQTNTGIKGFQAYVERLTGTDRDAEMVHMSLRFNRQNGIPSQLFYVSVKYLSA